MVKTNINIGSKELYLIISVLLVIGIMFVIYYYFTVECFIDAKILADDIKSDEEYRKCINENALLEQRTKGTIKGCTTLLSKLTSNGTTINNNTPYGKITDLCPVSTYSKTPNDCLSKRAEKQTPIIDALKNEIGNLKKNTLMQKINIDNGQVEHKQHVNSLYANKEIVDAINYINKNKYKIDNEEHDQLFKEKITITITPRPSNAPFKLGTPPPVKISKSID